LLDDLLCEVVCLANSESVFSMLKDQRLRLLREERWRKLQKLRNQFDYGAEHFSSAKEEERKKEEYREQRKKYELVCVVGRDEDAWVNFEEEKGDWWRTKCGKKERVDRKDVNFAHIVVYKQV
jgi:hypothetical protein